MRRTKVCGAGRNHAITVYTDTLTRKLRVDEAVAMSKSA